MLRSLISHIAGAAAAIFHEIERTGPSIHPGRRVERYARLAALLGAGEAGVPRRYHWQNVLAHAGGQLGLLALLTPVALVGWVAWLVPYWPPTLTVRIARPKLDAVASYKLVVAFLLFLAFWTALAWAVAGRCRDHFASLDE